MRLGIVYVFLVVVMGYPRGVKVREKAEAGGYRFDTVPRAGSRFFMSVY